MSWKRDKILAWANTHKNSIMQDHKTRWHNLVVAQCQGEYGWHVFDNAFILTVEINSTYDKYYIVFPEHHEIQVFHADEWDCDEFVHYRNDYPDIEFYINRKNNTVEWKSVKNES